MAQAPGQSSNGGEGGTAGDSGDQGGDAGSGANDSGNNNNSGDSGAQFDPTALNKDQLNLILEKNPDIWRTGRLAELREKGSKYDALQSEKEEAEKKALEEQGKFKELNEKLDGEVKTLKEQNQTLVINQQLVNKLAPLGVISLDDALKLVDRGKISVAEDGTITGLDEAVETLKTDKAYLFNEGGSGSSSSVGSATNPGNNGGDSSGVQQFKRSQLRDNNFYKEHREEIMKAQAAGKIIDDLGPSSQ